MCPRACVLKVVLVRHSLVRTVPYVLFICLRHRTHVFDLNKHVGTVIANQKSVSCNLSVVCHVQLLKFTILIGVDRPGL